MGRLVPAVGDLSDDQIFVSLVMLLAVVVVVLAVHYFVDELTLAHWDDDHAAAAWIRCFGNWSESALSAA